MATILIHANIDQSGPNSGLSAAPATDYIVEQNVHIGADSYGYDGAWADQALTNFGGVFSTGAAAVLLDGSNDHLANEAGASIAGADGVWMNDANQSVTNLGTIFGFDDGISQTGNSGSIDNRGYVHGDAFGIEEEASV